MTVDAGGNFTSACTARPHIWVLVYPATRRPFSGTGDLWFGFQCKKYHVGRRGIETAGGGQLTPRLEIGVRHDAGDAETGFGLDRSSEAAADVRARGLLTHEAGGFRDRGLAGSLTWDPRPDSDRGARMTLQQTVGASATGGMDALLSRTTMAGLAANDDGDELQHRRLETGSATASPPSATASRRRRRSASVSRTRAATTASAGGSGWRGAPRPPSDWRRRAARAPTTTRRSTGSACGSPRGSE